MGELSRFTPTGVGTTIKNYSVKRNASVHPHRCGDNWNWDNWEFGQDGSPPQVWGQRDGWRTRHECHPVHPHRCGDNHYNDAEYVFLCGSPPQVWGQHRIMVRRWSIRRFTPTGVGTTFMRASLGRAPPVHPHRCGDNGNGFRFQAVLCGSPPQVWGQRLLQPPNLAL